MKHELAGMFEDVDRMSVDGFLSYLTDDVVFRFGNAPELRGKQAVREAIELFFSGIAGLKHEPQGAWSEGDTTVLRFDTHYTKHDGVVLSVPCCVVVQFNTSRLIHDYRIHIDISSLFSTASVDAVLLQATA